MSTSHPPCPPELHALAARLTVVRGNPAWALDVGITELDWTSAKLLLEAPLTHLGAGRRLEVRQHRDGTWWSDPTTNTRAVVPWTRPIHEWGDETTGRIRTRVVWTMASPLEEAKRAASCAAWIANDITRYQGRAVDAALAIAADLEAGSLAQAVRQAEATMRKGCDDPLAGAMAAEALRARLALETVAFALADTILIDALARVDEALDACGEALLLIDDDDYMSIAGGADLDEDTWWGRRARLDQDVPASALVAALAGKRAGAEVVSLHPQARRRDSTAAEERGLFLAAAADRDLVCELSSVTASTGGERRSAFERTLRALAQTPAPWLRADLAREVDSTVRGGLEDPDLAWRAAAISETTSPAPGSVALPLYLPERNEGVVLELRVGRQGEGLWAGSPGLQALARDAVRAAHACLARSSLSGQPRLRLEQHQLRIVGPAAVLDAIRGIDGESIALPAALAFASLWLDRPLPVDLAATGALSVDGTSIRRVGPSGTAAKARALAEWGRGRRVRFLVPIDNARDTGDIVDAVPVAALEQALQVAGLAMQDSASWAALGDVAERIAALEALVRDLKTHDLAKHRVGSMDPWLVLADRMRLLIQSLRREPAAVPAAFLDTAQAYAALAYTHAGDERGAKLFPARLAVDQHTAPPVRVFMLLSQLVANVGTGSLHACLPWMTQLDEALPALRPDERAWLEGLVRGTQGRAWVHAREVPRAERLAKAIPLLREAVAHHEARSPAEVARSRIYLAMALRMAGDLDSAATELRLAADALENATRPWSGSYYRATRMYLAYERARLRVARNSSADALLEAICDTNDALREARERGGFWPAIGILRTQAWAYQLLGDETHAQHSRAQARELGASAPPGASAIVRRIAEELDTPGIEDGEVY